MVTGRTWRDAIWAELDRPWDLLIVGGGITGAGIFREATRAGLTALLVEQRDFAWGTSSRSSKLVHGGLRYLASGQVRLTWASVREREQLLDAGPGLIEPLGFLMVTEHGSKPGSLTYSAGLSLYDLMAGQWTHRRYAADEFRMLAPHIRQEGLEGGFRYNDAQTDDARLVLRLIREAVSDGGMALNYARVEQLVIENSCAVGAIVHDQIAERSAEIRARVIINATGAWADHLREQVGAESRIRPLRGSHLILPGWRLPLAQALAFAHPFDERPVFAFPWEGVIIVGTTDLDHNQPLNAEPHISPGEVAYLMAAITHQFPGSEITLDDVISTFAGVRPVIGTGKEDPSRESREHVIWSENGLLTVTGGKLTTFRMTALQALREIRQQLPEMANIDNSGPALGPAPEDLPGAEHLSEADRRRLQGRYGADAPALVATARTGELKPIPGTHTLWVELRWTARTESVVHLDDLLLRRVRIGLLQPQGGSALLPRIRAICQAELGWSDEQWDAETAAYIALWRTHYSLPDRHLIPDWQTMLRQITPGRTRRSGRRLWLALFIITAAAVLLHLRHRNRAAT